MMLSLLFLFLLSTVVFSYSSIVSVRVTGLDCVPCSGSLTSLIGKNAKLEVFRSGTTYMCGTNLGDRITQGRTYSCGPITMLPGQQYAAVFRLEIKSLSGDIGNSNCNDFDLVNTGFELSGGATCNGVNQYYPGSNRLDIDLYWFNG